MNILKNIYIQWSYSIRKYNLRKFVDNNKNFNVKIKILKKIKIYNYLKNVDLLK
jgi:hypothetical protein